MLNTNCDWFEQKYKELNAEADLVMILKQFTDSQEESKEELKSTDEKMIDTSKHEPKPNSKKSKKNKDCVIF